jgi:hypothetical protein
MPDVARVRVRIVGVHFHCGACGARVRIPMLPPVEEEFGKPARAWCGSHLDPHIDHVDTSTTASPAGNGFPVP